MLAEIGHQSDLVVGRPFGKEMTEAAMLSGHTLDEGGIVANGPDLLRIAHDALIGSQIVPEIVRLEQQPLRLETQKSLLEAWPFLLDDPPDETGGEDPLGHGRENAVVRDLGDGGVVGHRPEQRRKLRFAALAFCRAQANFLKISHRSLAVRRNVSLPLGAGSLYLYRQPRPGDSHVQDDR